MNDIIGRKYVQPKRRNLKNAVLLQVAIHTACMM